MSTILPSDTSESRWIEGGSRLITGLNAVGAFLPLLALRLLLAFEFWNAGWEKLTGSNWFSHIQADFPFPFNVIPVEVSWFLVTWTELLAAALLVIGLATRFAAFALMILTGVAWYSVHAGLGYNVCDNGWLLPAWMLIMLLPLLFMGPGKASLDHWISRRLGRP